MVADAKELRGAPVRKMLAWAASGREALFGADLSPVAWAIKDALPPFGAPHINTEVPLAGEPGTDVHVRCSYGHFHGTATPSPGPFWSDHQALLEWAEAELVPGEGIGVSYDLRARRLTTPAVYYKGVSVGGFFSSLGIPEAAQRYRAAKDRLPEGWRCWYRGSFPNRQGCPMRLGIVLTRKVQDLYADNPSRLARDLAAAGIQGIGERVVAFLSQQAAQPYLFDIELDVAPDGSIGDTVGFNLTLGLAGEEARGALASGGVHDVLVRAQQVGLADERWRLLGDAAFRRLVPSTKGAARGYVSCENRLVYLKLRLKNNEPLNVKAYFQTVWARA